MKILLSIVACVLIVVFTLNSTYPAKSNSYYASVLLPAFDSDEEIISHTAYTLCYSEPHEQSRYVAYRLTREMVENATVKRKDDFRADPAVTTGSATLADYKKSNYDKGHLCPALDMAWSHLTMSESFYTSNISPQCKGFNRGLWKKLEGKVRAWAKRDKEIYVVTGGVLSDGLRKIGKKNKVSVPKYFYKVILDYTGPELKAIGFIMANEVSKRDVLSYAVTVDSVERLTGIDFFPALPDSLENLLEGNVDTTKWR